MYDIDTLQRSYKVLYMFIRIFPRVNIRVLFLNKSLP